MYHWVCGDRRGTMLYSVYALLLLASLHSIKAQWLEDCGVSKYEDAGEAPQAQIVGGWDARPHEFPWQISMHRLRESGEFTHSCGGSIINENWILSAAHCVDTSEVETLKIYVGDHNLTDESNTERSIHDVEVIFFHENYDPSTTQNDVAVLRLTESIVLTENVTGVCPAEAERDYTGQECVVSGWGVEQFGAPDIPEVLKYTLVPITPQDHCEERYALIGANITEDMICAGDYNETESDACQGDSGGPLVCEVDARWQEVGIVSWGFGCAYRAPGVYASVAYFLDWIEDTINAYEGSRAQHATQV